MALGRPNRVDTKYISLKLRLKEGEQFLDNAFFDLQAKDASGEYKSQRGAALAAITGNEDPIRDVAGDLVKIETRVGEYEGAPVRSFKLHLRDGGETYTVDASLGSNLAKGLANSILNLQDNKDVSLGLYSQKNPTTKKLYPAVSVRQGKDSNVTVKWKYDPKAEGTELPAAREYPGKIDPKTKKPKIEKDWTEVEEFFLAKLNDFAKVVEGWVKGEATSTASTTTPTESVAQGSTDTDLPF
jgi:hypothetical protein